MDKKNKKNLIEKAVIAYIPISLLYMEFAFHEYMKMELKYSLIFSMFAILFGLVASFILSFIPNRKLRVWLSVICVTLISIVFIAEMLLREILQEYYQIASGLSVALDNNIAGFTDVISMGLKNNYTGIILMVIPVIIGILIGTKVKDNNTKVPKLKLKYAAAAVAFYLLGLATLYIPWNAAYQPLELYKGDTHVTDQVEKLGLSTMLILDINHCIFGVDKELSYDFETEATEPKEINYEPNQLNIDFDLMNENTDNETKLWLNNYFMNKSSTYKNQYTGMFEGYNVIFFTLEGFDGYMLDEELTPTLYKMANEGFVFNNFYTPLHFTSTSGGEFRNLTGLYPKNGFPISMMEIGSENLNMPYALAAQLGNEGYTVLGYHANEDMYGRYKSHTQLGYEWIQRGYGFNMELNEYGKFYWPQSDKYTIEQTIDDYINNEPFHIYYLTMSGHLPYTISGNSMTKKNWDEIEESKFSEYSAYTKGYLAANLELEKALVYLNEKLEEAGIADNTLIVMVPDHIPYFDIPIIEELADKEFGTSSLESINEAYIDFEVYRSSLIIWSSSIKEPIEVDDYCSQVDVLPTVSNLLGLEYDSRLMAGRDILAEGEKIVIMASKSWITKEGTYNKVTDKFEPAESCTMNAEEKEEYIKRINSIVDNKIDSSVYVIETDYYQDIIYE